MFHVVYSRHYWDREDGGYGTFANTWTIYRNVSYSQIRDMQSKILSMKKSADKVYADYESKQENTTRPKNTLAPNTQQQH